LPTATGYGSLVVSAFKTDGNVALTVCIPYTDGSILFRAGSADGADTKSTGVLQASQYKGQWNHWVFTKDDGGFVHIYLNGGLFWADLNWGTHGCETIATFRIGKGSPGKYDQSSAYKGMLDEFRMYNYALSATDVANLYSADSTRFSGQIGRWTFDENAGATTADATPFGSNGTITNAAWSNGRIGSALHFEGVSSNVSIPATALASLDKQVTITLWQYGAPSPPRDNWIFEALDAAGGPTIRAAVPGIGGAVVFDAGFGGAAHFDAARTTAVGFDGSNYQGQWNHWAFTKNAVSGVMNIYLNGLLWHSAAGKYRPLTPARTFQIGSNASGASSYAGVIDDVRIYNLELDPSDIYNIYLDCPPLPNPMTWSTPPQAAGPTSIAMAAAVALHPNGVEYYFQCTAGGGHDSGWQALPSYTDTGLAEQTEYTYVVMAREKGPNHHETGLSSVRSAFTLDGTVPAFKFEYVTSAVSLLNGDGIVVHVVNDSGAAETTRVVIFKSTEAGASIVNDTSRVVVTPSVNFGSGFTVSQSGEYWLRMEATSESLIPEASFERLRESVFIPVVSYRPGDFAAFELQPSRKRLW